MFDKSSFSQKKKKEKTSATREEQGTKRSQKNKTSPVSGISAYVNTTPTQCYAIMFDNDISRKNKLGEPDFSDVFGRVGGDQTVAICDFVAGTPFRQCTPQPI
jgi:hypothetical protein